MKKPFLIIILLLVSTISMIGVNTVHAQLPTAKLSIIFPNGTSSSINEYVPGNTFTVNINIAEVTDFYGVDFKLWYKTSVLTATEVTLGPFLKPGYATWKKEINDTVGYVYYSVSQAVYELTGVSGSGTLATITFTVDALGASYLSLSDTFRKGGLYESNTKLTDHLGQQIAHTVEDGHFVNSNVHDIAITSVVPDYIRVLPSEHPDHGNLAVILEETINVNVTARNHGYFTESFTVTAYADATAIGTPQTVADLAPGGRTTLTFTWNTAGLPLGKYIISATAPLSGDTDTTDNTCNKAYDFDKKIFVDVTITVIDYPVATFNYSPTQPVVNKAVTFNASDSTPNGGKINYYGWNFGDGVSASSSVLYPQDHPYTSHGTYNATLTIRDNEGLSDTTWQLINVSLPPGPSAKFIYSPSKPIEGQPVNFDASLSTSDPATNASIISYAWDFDDGTSGNGMTTTHTYTKAGSYTVKLNVTDSEGLWNTVQKRVTVYRRDVAILSVTPSKTEVTIGETVSIVVTVKNEGNFPEPETFNVTAYYNNTNIQTINVPNLARGANTTLTFTWDTTNVNPGTYTIKANATSVEGETETNDNEKPSDGTVTLKLSSTISISATSTAITVGESTTISGSITPTRAGATVMIWYRLSGGTWSTLETVTTDENSQYSHPWTPETAGTYEIKASWEGDENTLQDESDTYTVTVNEAPTGIPLYVIAAVAAIIIIASCIAAYYLIRKKP